MIIDSFLFLNELDLLEIRLNELNSVVDQFVLLESLRTFSNKDKPLFFSENKSRFAPFLHKIQQVVLTELPSGDNPWAREIYQRKVMLKVLRDFPKDSVCMISDLDEIPSRDSVAKAKEIVKSKPQPVVLFHHFCHGYINQILTKSNSWSFWGGTRVALSSYWTEDKGGRELPGAQDSSIYNAGWHFRNIGNLDDILYKLKSYSHHRDKTSNGFIQENLSIDQIEDRINQKSELCEDGFLGEEFDEKFWPEYVRENKSKFNHLFKKW